MKIRWKIVIPFGLLHLGAIGAFFFFSWTAFYTAMALWLCTGLFGICVGYHRYLTHNAFQTSEAVKAFHLFWAALAFQQGPLSWVRIHRAHHAYSDSEKDPHPQRYGFFYGHIGWTLFDYPDRGKSKLALVAPSQLRHDPVIRFFEAHHMKMYVASLVVLFLVGGLPMLLWAGCFRTVFCLHAAFCVNSVTHRFGYRNFDVVDSSTNNWWVALITWGEGWHNNHHKYPLSARQGLRWWEIDLSYIWISILKALGLVWNVRVAKYSRGEKASQQSSLGSLEAGAPA